MAGEWINRDTGLRSHPAILHLWLHFEKKQHRGFLADCVCEMWAYADQFGHVEGDDIVCELTTDLLDAHVDLPGFSVAMTKFRESVTNKKPWLVVEDGRLRFPGLYAVMDSSSKRRAEKRERKKRERAKRKNGDVSHDCRTNVASMSHDICATGGPKQQQITEHRTQNTNKDTPQPPKGLESVGFLDFWNAWPPSDRKHDRKGCARKWASLELEPLATLIVADVNRRKTSPDWTKDGGQYIPAPMVYLNQRRWEAATTQPARRALGVD
jgi:hypothetical protein